MDDLVLHDLTREQLQAFMASPSHALLLTGPAGIGKTAVAEAVATALLGAPLTSHPYHLLINYSFIDPEKPSIPIEAIRELQKFLLLKTTGSGALRRSVIIEDAHKMTLEAQNAFLKLLEEPPADTLIILTAVSSRLLLPTILSRTQHITVNVPTEGQLRALMNKSADKDAAKQAYFLSGGLPGLLSALLDDGQDHPLATSVNLAKDVLQKQPFERLAMVDALSKQKETALGLTEALERIARAGLHGAASKQDAARIKQWHKVRKTALQAQTALQNSVNTKLVLDNLFLNV